MSTRPPLFPLRLPHVARVWLVSNAPPPAAFRPFSLALSLAPSFFHAPRRADPPACLDLFGEFRFSLAGRHRFFSSADSSTPFYCAPVPFSSPADGVPPFFPDPFYHLSHLSFSFCCCISFPTSVGPTVFQFLHKELICYFFLPARLFASGLPAAFFPLHFVARVSVRRHFFPFSNLNVLHRHEVAAPSPSAFSVIPFFHCDFVVFFSPSCLLGITPLTH